MTSQSPYRSLLWYSIPFFIRNFIPLISLPILTAYISVNDFGLLALSIVYGTFLTGISNMGLFTVFERTFFQIKVSDRNDLLFTNVCFVASILSVSALFTWEFNSFIAETIFKNPLLSPFLFFAFLLSGIKTLNQYFFYFLKNAEEPKKYTVITVAENILSFGIALVFVIIYEKGVLGYLTGQLIGVSIIFLLNMIILCFSGKRIIKLMLLKQQLKLSLPLTPRIFFGIINGQFDRYMLGLLASTGGVGLYDIAQKFANTTYSFMTMLQNVFAPQVYKRLFSEDEIYKKSIGAYLSPFFYLTTFFSMGVVLFSEEIIYLATPEEYHESSLYVSILSFLFIFHFFGKQPQLLFAKKTALISFLSFLSILLNIGFNIPLIYFFGLDGAVWATFMSGIISSGLYYYYGQKHLYIFYERKLFVTLLYFMLSCILIITMIYSNQDYRIKIISKFTVLTGYIWMGFHFKYFEKIKFLVGRYFKRKKT
ncbi:oligosaccharide flippase family protein [Flavobacteriaceae bacterium]|nr:oligosaccharide flippase family protein [Flavobacteriaceae bacterium]